jgi:low temperature requirement protein LtrA
VNPATTGRVTNIELLFDLVYVFAVTQLSHYLLPIPPEGALRAGLLLIMVWLLWVYTTWVTIGLFLAGHAAFKAVIWRRVSWPRPGALAVLGLLGLAAPYVTALTLGACTAG